MRNISIIIFLSLILTSCASTYQYNKIANPKERDSELATICVLRPTTFGSAIKFGIYENEKLIGKLGPKSYLAWTVKPDGKELTITSKSENKDMLVINPKPGKTYYIKQKVKLGVVVARTGLEFLDENEAKELLIKLKEPQSKYAE